jgi:transcriptional regulator of aroF, aroG, tyrA and aromatic amino acid transport
MRLEVFCEDRLGLTRELLDLLVLRGIDLRGSRLTLSGEFTLILPSWSSIHSAA